jgi:perosamine synthetase
LQVFFELIEHLLIYLIEDCAEAIGSKYKGQNVGTFGDISTFSFFGNKTITTGEGGMVLSNDEKLHDKVVRFKGQGLAKNREYWHDVIGYNYRMTNIHAAILYGQFKYYDEIRNKKLDMVERYNLKFKNTSIRIQKTDEDVMHSNWMYGIRFSNEMEKLKVQSALEMKNIETRPMFAPMSYHKHLKDYANVNNESNAKEIYNTSLILPSYPDLSIKDIDLITTIIINTIEKQ